MYRRFRPWLLLVPTVLPLVGCDYGGGAPAPQSRGIYQPGVSPLPASSKKYGTSGQALAVGKAGTSQEQKAAILDSVISLIKQATMHPGGENFRQATQKLNHYFDGTFRDEYAISPAARAYLTNLKWTERAMRDLERPEFTIKDSRHLEDCMMYYGITTRVGGTGDDLTRVSRVFDWIVRQVQLVPPGSLGTSDLPHAFARPFDVLVRGMATEDGGSWAERSWLFMAFCRQLGIDAGLLSYTPRNQKEPIAWICGVLINGKVYLFDARIGMPIPRLDGQGVATIDDALADNRVLGRLDLPGLSIYGTTRGELLASPSKISVMLDSSQGYISPRMRLLQRELRGKDRTILFRDPAEQNEAFAKALGERFGGTRMWDLPMKVETLLFTEPKFMAATQRALALFPPDLPLLYARMEQLRGETPRAIEDYVRFRFAEGLLKTDGKTPVPPEYQDALNVYATYFLGLANLDQNNPKQAEFFFQETLRLVPAYGPGQPFYNMFRWGAASNLGRLNEAKGDLVQATAYYSAKIPTPQHHGDLVRARNLVWRDPLAPVPAPLPPAPRPSGAGLKTAAAIEKR